MIFKYFLTYMCDSIHYKSGIFNDQTDEFIDVIKLFTHLESDACTTFQKSWDRDG